MKVDPIDVPLISVRGLSIHYPIGSGPFGGKSGLELKAVSDISFDIDKGKTLGLVGESGCGKSTAGRASILLRRPTSGEVWFDGKRMNDLTDRQLRDARREMQMIFQDPFSSLSPHFTVGELIAEPIRVHGLRKGKAAVRDRVSELLELVGLDPAVADRFPHQFSGGQRQRIGCARALAVEPKFIVCDEAVSALDVSVQAQVVNLLQDIQRKLNLTYLFIAHDLGVVHHISDRIAVMYLGKIVEMADADELVSRPQHPYTQALLSAVPIAEPRTSQTRTRIVLKGDIPTPLLPPKGCRFHTRCPLAIDVCSKMEPPLEARASGGDHEVACHRAGEVIA